MLPLFDSRHPIDDVMRQKDRSKDNQPTASHEDILAGAEIQIERKTFAVFLKQNARGRFLRITETSAGKRNTVIVPASGLSEFARVVQEMQRVEVLTQAGVSMPSPSATS